MSLADTDSSVFIHPTAVCEAPIEVGTRVWAFAHIMSGATVGHECNIGDHTFVESGAVVGDRVTLKNNVMVWDKVTLHDDVFVGPSVIFTNDKYPRSLRMPEIVALGRSASTVTTATVVERGASIGAGAILIAGITVGAFAMVGAGALVTKNVPPHRLVVGNPARPVGWVCLCGKPVTGDDPCDDCGRRWRVECDSLIAVE